MLKDANRPYKKHLHLFDPETKMFAMQGENLLHDF